MSEDSIVFAIVEDGGRQYRVSIGDELAIDLRDGVQVGDAVTFDRVMLISNGQTRIGQPLVGGATVTAEVVEPLFKGPKLEIQKFRRRKNSRRHTGHRQKYTVVKITGIN